MHWSSFQKIIFRFLFCYFFFYTMSNQFVLSFVFEEMWQKVVPWFADTFLHLPEKITIFTNGSGDTTYNYVSMLVYAIVSVIITIIWSVMDRHRPNYQTMLQWLAALVCYYAIFQMLNYGLAKIFYLQFSEPRFSRLAQSYGDSSPMGLLWTFMGYSKGYTIFAGLGEFAGGLLLFFRRTRTLGAMIVFGVMANVMAMNFFYDVPVKLLSSHLVLISLFLIALDAKRLWNVFVANKPTGSLPLAPYFENPKTERIRFILKWIFVVGFVGYSFYDTYSVLDIYGPNAPKPRLYGLYEVETFERNGQNVAPLTTDSTRWERLDIDWKDFAQVKTMTKKNLYYTFKPDSLENFVLMNLRQDSIIDTLHFSYPDSVHLQLEGVHKNDTLKILMKSKKKEDYLLMKRGFRWVNEYPFNR